MGQQYDAIAVRDAEVERVVGPYRERVEVPSLVGALGVVEGASVLDVGCGSGAYARLLRRRGAAEVVGVDVSAAMVAEARRAEEREPLGVRYEVHDLVDLPVLGEFSAAVAVAVLHYADSRRALARMCERICANLAPGGRLLALVGNPRLVADVPQANGFVVHRPEGLRDGDPYTISVPTVPPTMLRVHHWDCGTFEEVLLGAGFARVVWEPLRGLADGDGGGEPVNLLLRAEKG
ncbi:class I SAM-dependent methyltransferase [Streptomyces catenulae]|uniref:Class I SAM-dependent methyltransferase n=1 Tax=Streptomyces catenulae TaxID=66875 RepID=A0ABV2Z457_9ACTN|nr:class I SAM-dependent methyltransferase [Streptomyces catenulae]